MNYHNREMALQLRRKGKSYNYINKTLGVPKSTLSGWFKGLDFSIKVKQQLIDEAKKKWAANITLYNKNRAAIILKEEKEIQEEESKKITEISDRELWLLGTALYWAEGSKSDRWKVKFTNSDPCMIEFMMAYFRRICKVDNSKFRLLAQIHPNISEKKAKKYWHYITGIPYFQFYKTQVAISRASKRKREARKLPYGTIAISINDKKITNQLKGWINGLSRLGIKKQRRA
jgi:hypothetical protein